MNPFFKGNVWFVIPLLSVNKLINTYSVYDVFTGRVTVWPSKFNFVTFPNVW